MSFAWPHLLWLLAAPLALLVWERRHRRRAASATRPKILRAEAGAHSLQFTDPTTASAPATGGRPRIWLCAGLALTLVALARPQWGRLEEPVFDQSREILLAVDLSRSMLAPDVKPSRLARTKLLIQSLLEKLSGERVGLVVFSGTSFLQAPLSADYEILREFLPSLGPDFLPEGGTHYGAMLDTALQAFGTTSAADRFLIVLSDGEATDTEWRTRFDDLKKKNIRVLSLGVGTAGGGMIPDGAGGLVKDERGAVVLSKLESGTLQELARATGGTYRDASTWLDLAGLVNETIEAGRKGEFVEKHTVRLVERFQWPLAFAVWCLLVSFYYEFPVRPKPRSITLRPGARVGTTPPPMKTEKPNLAGTASLLLLGLVSLALLPAPARAAIKLAPGAQAPDPTAGSSAPTTPSPSTPPAIPAQPGPPASAPATPPEPPALAKIVGRLSAAPLHTARDWAELGRETVTWGSRIKSQGQPVNPGPVHDALGAVDLGEKLDAQTTDWSKLRQELEALLEKPEEEKDKKDDPQKQEKSDQNKSKDQQKQDEKSQDQQNEDQSQDQQQQQNQDQQQQNQQQKSDQQKGKPDEQKQPDESALGDMSRKEEPPPPPPENMQKVGGQPEKQEMEQKEQMDPALALPLQKLEQLRNQDSPAHLFQLMEGDKKPTKKTGKDW